MIFGCDSDICYECTEKKYKIRELEAEVKRLKYELSVIRSSHNLLYNVLNGD
jgi:hypothetical protein